MNSWTRWTLALAAGALAIGWTAAALAQGNEVADYCQTSLKGNPDAKNFPDIGKFCGCVGEKVPAEDRAVTVTVMKASDEARAKGGRLDPATLPPEQAKALEALRKAVPSCMERATAAPPSGKMTGLAAWNKLIGNTVAGKVAGKDYAEFYRPDGTVKTMTDNELMTGTWSVEGEKVCFVYPQEDKACFTLELVGDDVTFTDEAGEGIRVKLLPGNPKNL